MHSDRLELLANCIRDPTDVVALARYKDWLLEHGRRELYEWIEQSSPYIIQDSLKHLLEWHIPEHGIWNYFPIVQIKLTDKFPGKVFANYVWENNRLRDGPSNLPGWLCNLLTNHDWESDKGKVYTSLDTARKDVSDSLLNIWRSAKLKRILSAD